MLRALAQVHPTAGWRACKWARKWRSAMAAILPSGFVQPPGTEFDAFSCSCPGLSGCCSSPHRYRGALRAMQGVSVGGTESRCVNSASCCGRHDDTHEQPTRSIMCLQDIVKWVQETEGNRYLGLFRNSAASPKVTYCSKRSLHANFPVPAHIRSVRVAFAGSSTFLDILSSFHVQLSCFLCSFPRKIDELTRERRALFFPDEIKRLLF